MKKTIVESQFLLEKSEKKGFWIYTDKLNKIVCNFEEGKFNETQKFTFLSDQQFSNLPSIMRAFGHWLWVNHRDKI
jgi:hypothetical protein